MSATVAITSGNETNVTRGEYIRYEGSPRLIMSRIFLHEFHVQHDADIIQARRTSGEKQNMWIMGLYSIVSKMEHIVSPPFAK